MRFAILGPIELRDGDLRAGVGAPQQVTLLAVGADELDAIVWLLGHLYVSAAMGAVLCEIGRPQDARRHADLVREELAELPNDDSTLAILASSAITCAQLRDTVTAEQLHALLEPHAAQFVNTGASWLGAVEHHLAVLDAAAGRTARADERFASADRAYAHLGAVSWQARCQLDWASALLDRSHEGDPERASALTALAPEAARELHVPAVASRAETLAARAAVSTRR